MTGSKISLILEPTKYPRTDPDIIYGKTKPTISKKGYRKYPNDYNPILEYWEQVEKGETLLPLKVYQQYEEIVSWIKEDGYKEWFYSPERANHIIEFAENFCCHSKGKLAGKKVVLELWEKAYLAATYGFIDIEGNRKHQRTVLIVGKKNGKSLLDSIMGLYGLVGDNEGGPEVYAVARVVATLNRVKSVKAKFNIETNIEMYLQGHSQNEVAKTFNISRNTLRKELKARNINP